MGVSELDRPERRQERRRRNGFTRHQKEWIKRAYEEILGFSGCVFPVWNWKTGEYEYCGKSEDVQIHHIKPRGWCIKILGIDPNVPTNGAPLCEEHHVGGQKRRPLTRRAQDVIHLDIAFALRKYSEEEGIFKKVMNQRTRLLTEGQPYWYELWDHYLSELATDVVEEYMTRFPRRRWSRIVGSG